MPKSTSRKKVAPKKVHLDELLLKAFTDPAFTDILKGAMDDPEALHTDRGKDFYNSSMAQWLKKRNIRHFRTHGDHKATIVGRFNRTIKQSIFDYMIFTPQTLCKPITLEHIHA